MKGRSHGCKLVTLRTKRCFRKCCLLRLAWRQPSESRSTVALLVPSRLAFLWWFGRFGLFCMLRCRGGRRLSARHLGGIRTLVEENGRYRQDDNGGTNNGCDRNPLPALRRSICSLFCAIQKNGRRAGLFHPIPKSASLPCRRYCALSGRPQRERR